VLATLPDTVRLPPGVLVGLDELVEPAPSDPDAVGDPVWVAGACAAGGNATSWVVEDPVADFSTTRSPIPVSSAPNPVVRRHRVRL
jgi:hypothetical protein